MWLAAHPAAAQEAPAEVPARSLLHGLEVRGYVQPQAVWSQESEDALDPDGRPLNQDRFRIRRARLEVSRTSDLLFAGVEVDFNTMERTSLTLAGAEVALLVRGPPSRPPYLRVGFGMDRVPFGFELLQTIRERPFAERTFGSRAFFPADSDVGLKASGAVGPLRYALAAVNGVPIGPDATTTVTAHQKTAIGRVGFQTDVARGGVSFLKGTGFHPGTVTTKTTLQWQDANQDGLVTLNELIGVVGQAATPSATFDRWGVNADLGVTIRTRLGQTELGAEVTLAANLDRGFLVADPVATGFDLREVSWMVYAVQEITDFAILAVRADRYDPSSDLFEFRRGQFLPVDPSVFTFTSLGGARWPGRGSLLLQYDYVVDLLGVDGRGEPIDLPNDLWTLAAQVEF